MRLRGLCALELIALLAMLAAGCTTRSEDTSCPAIERALDEAVRRGEVESLPLAAGDERYEIALEDRRVDSNCNVSYRFRISGLDPAIFSSPDSIERRICGPNTVSGPARESWGVHMDDGDFIIDAQVSQWQPTGRLSFTVGELCAGLTLSFMHVGRVAQP